jgi:hypothetical protein
VEFIYKFVFLNMRKSQELEYSLDFTAQKVCFVWGPVICHPMVKARIQTLQNSLTRSLRISARITWQILNLICHRALRLNYGSPCINSPQKQSLHLPNLVIILSSQHEWTERRPLSAFWLYHVSYFCHLSFLFVFLYVIRRSW